MATKKTTTKKTTDIDPIKDAMRMIQAAQAAPLKGYDAGKAVDPGTKVFRQSDLDYLQEQIDWLYRKNLFTLYSGASSHAIAFEPGGVFLVFITWGSVCNFYFVNSGTSTAYSKTLVDQMSGDVTVTRDGLTYTYASTAGNNLSVFVKRIN